ATIGGNIAANKSASDIIGTLIAYKALLLVITGKDKKEIPVDSWIKSPEGLIVEIKFPEPERQIFHRRFSRTKNDLPLVKITAGFTKENGGGFEDVIIAASSVAEKVIVLENTSKYLNGKAVADINEEQIRAAVDKDINPIDDHRASAAYRKELVYTAVDEFVNYKG
ncbi:MAG: FAD binding domain-containing protein, partial [Elusimicrobiota bacterium]|nr:FAD binding domain-containing protein [Elusimicrobiota bacterium]